MTFSLREIADSIKAANPSWEIADFSESLSRLLLQIPFHNHVPTRSTESIRLELQLLAQGDLLRISSEQLVTPLPNRPGFEDFLKYLLECKKNSFGLQLEYDAFQGLFAVYELPLKQRLPTQAQLAYGVVLLADFIHDFRRADQLFEFVRTLREEFPREKTRLLNQKVLMSAAARLSQTPEAKSNQSFLMAIGLAELENSFRHQLNHRKGDATQAAIAPRLQSPYEAETWFGELHELVEKLISYEVGIDLERAIQKRQTGVIIEPIQYGLVPLKATANFQKDSTAKIQFEFWLLGRLLSATKQLVTPSFAEIVRADWLEPGVELGSQCGWQRCPWLLPPSTTSGTIFRWKIELAPASDELPKEPPNCLKAFRTDRIAGELIQVVQIFSQQAFEQLRNHQDGDWAEARRWLLDYLDACSSYPSNRIELRLGPDEPPSLLFPGDLQKEFFPEILRLKLRGLRAGTEPAGENRTALDAAVSLHRQSGVLHCTIAAHGYSLG